MLELVQYHFPCCGSDAFCNILFQIRWGGLWMVIYIGNLSYRNTVCTLLHLLRFIVLWLSCYQDILIDYVSPCSQHAVVTLWGNLAGTFDGNRLLEWSKDEPIVAMFVDTLVYQCSVSVQKLVCCHLKII